MQDVNQGLERAVMANAPEERAAPGLEPIHVSTTKTSNKTASFLFGAFVVYCLGVLKSTLGTWRAPSEAAK